MTISLRSVRNVAAGAVGAGALAGAMLYGSPAAQAAPAPAPATSFATDDGGGFHPGPGHGGGFHPGPGHGWFQPGPGGFHDRDDFHHGFRGDHDRDDFHHGFFGHGW